MAHLVDNDLEPLSDVVLHPRRGLPGLSPEEKEGNPQAWASPQRTSASSVLSWRQ